MKSKLGILFLMILFFSTNVFAETLTFISVTYINGAVDETPLQRYYFVVSDKELSETEREMTILRVDEEPQFPRYTMATTSKVKVSYNEGGTPSCSGKTPMGYPFEVPHMEPMGTTAEVKPEGTILPLYCGTNILESTGHWIKEVCIEEAEVNTTDGE